jgi:hypothetical protein
MLFCRGVFATLRLVCFGLTVSCLILVDFFIGLDLRLDLREIAGFLRVVF